MKKIVKDGIVPQSDAKCTICDCEFIYDRNEVIKVSDSEYHVECPCCKERLTIHYENKVILKIF